MKKLILLLVFVGGLISCEKEVEVEKIVYVDKIVEKIVFREDVTITNDLKKEIEDLTKEITSLQTQLNTTSNELMDTKTNYLETLVIIDNLQSMLSIEAQQSEFYKDESERIEHQLNIVIKLSNQYFNAIVHSNINLLVGNDFYENNRYFSDNILIVVVAPKSTRLASFTLSIQAHTDGKADIIAGNGRAACCFVQFNSSPLNQINLNNALKYVIDNN